MKKLFTLLMLIIFITNVKAFENDYFKLDVPEGYKEEISEKIYKWSKDNQYVSITIGNNPESYNIKNYTDEDLKRQKEYLENLYSNSLKEYNMTIDISDMTRDTINGYSILKYGVFWPSKDLTGYDIYQRGAVYTTKNYIYTILLSDDKEISEEDFNKILQSFELKDKDFTFSNKLIPIILIGGAILGVIGYFIDRKKKRA